jgi:hypothetical protein
MPRIASRVVAVGLLCVATAGRCVAGQTGHYAGGVANAHDFFLPAPGTYYAQYNYWYHTDTFRNADGHAIDQVTVFPNVPRLRRTVDVDGDLNQFVISPVRMWAPDGDFHGIRYGAYLTQPIANPSLDAAITGVERGIQFDENTWGAGDPFVQPLWLQWSNERLDVSFSYGFYAPSGRFTAGATDNIGLGYWTQQLQNAAQLWLDEARTVSLIGVQTWELNDPMEDTDLRPGPRATVNWGLGKSFREGLLEAVIVGYDCFQVSPDSGSDQPLLGRGAQDQVHAVGLQLGSSKYGLSVKYMREFGAEDRFEGDVFTITFGLPLDPLFETIASLAD